MSGSLSWDVTLPDRRARAAQARPRARLSLSSEAGGEEELSLPVAVGRRLAARRRGGPEPSSRAELLHLVGELARTCAHERVEDLVRRRDYSRHELAEKLRADGYSRAVVDETVGRAAECGLVDDARFAAAFARSKAAAGWGKIRVERELARRGVDASSVEGWPDEFFSADDERARALELAGRRRLTGKNDYARIVRFLCGRGFPMGLSRDVAAQVVDGTD